MSDSKELEKIRARDAGIGNDAAFHLTMSQVYLDRRALLQMLDAKSNEANELLKVLENIIDADPCSWAGVIAAMSIDCISARKVE